MAMSLLESDPERPKPKLGSSRNLRNMFLVLLMLLIASIAFAPIVQAASFSYAYEVPTSALQARYSGNQSLIKGGFAKTQLFSPEGAAAIVRLETYRPAPGYQLIAASSSGESTRLSHLPAVDASQLCFWNWPWSTVDIGKLKLTCSTNF